MRFPKPFLARPHPTAIATLGILLTANGRARWELLTIPVIWCVISSLTLWTMGSPDAAAPALVACLAVLLAVSAETKFIVTNL